MTFAPGQSGNPNGKPKKDIDLGKLARAFGDEAFNTLVALLKSADEKIRLAAAKEMLDRGYGRPAQTMELTGKDGKELIPKLVIERRS